MRLLLLFILLHSNASEIGVPAVAHSTPTPRATSTAEDCENPNRIQLPVPAVDDSRVVGRIEKSESEVFILRDGKRYVFCPSDLVGLNNKLLKTDTVITEKNSRASVRFLNGAVGIELGPNSDVKIGDFNGGDRMPETIFTVRGALDIAFHHADEAMHGTFKERLMRIKTPTGTLGVRGTKFKVLTRNSDRPDIDEVFETTEGSIWVLSDVSKKKAIVPAGFKVQLSGSGQFSKLIPLPKRNQF